MEEVALGRTLAEDVRAVAQEARAFAEELSGSTVLVTGATGLLGSLLVYGLAWASREMAVPLRIVAVGRSADRLNERFGCFDFCSSVECVVADVKEPLPVEGPVDYIVHGASPTSSRFFVEHPVDTIVAAFEGTRNVLELARRTSARGVVYLSSLEAYGMLEQHPQPIREDEGGFIDPLSVRSSYSEGKRLCETLCAAYASEFGVPVKVARLTQTFGAGVDYADGRVFAEFMRCVLEGRPIVLHSEGRTVRSYCYTADAVRAILLVLLRGQVGEAYNVANGATAVSIREMAHIAADALGSPDTEVRVEIPDDVAAYGYNPEMVAVLDSGKLEGLGWSARHGLPEMFQRMASPFADDVCERPTI